MIRTYGFAEGGLLNHSYMHGSCGSMSPQYAVNAQSFGRSACYPRLMGRRVVPDQKPPYPAFSQRLHSGGYVLASSSLPSRPHQPTREHGEKSHHRAVSVPPTDDDLGACCPILLHAALKGGNSLMSMSHPQTTPPRPHRAPLLPAALPPLFTLVVGIRPA